MFDKLRRALDGVADEINRRAGQPVDLNAVPDVAGRTFGEVDLQALSAYVGRPVRAVEPMGAMGHEATSFLGRRAQSGLRRGTAGRPLEPGELLPGQNAARIERLRASGVPEDQIRLIQERIAEVSAAHTADGWSVVFDGDKRASVQLSGIGTEAAAEFDRLAARWARENGTDGNRAEESSLLHVTVQRDASGPYETYTLAGQLTARGRTHVAQVRSVEVGTRILVALATVALRTVGD